MKWKVTAVISTSCLLLIVLSGLLYFGLNRRFLPGHSGLNPPTLITQIQKLNDLVTVKYTLQRVVGMTEPKTPFGEESILLMVQGQAMAGVDLSRLTASDVIASGGRLNIRVPQAKLINVSLDEDQTKVWDRRVSWWTPWVSYDPDLEHKARLAAINDVRSTAIKMGILDDAQRQARVAIGEFLKAMQIDADVALARGND